MDGLPLVFVNHCHPEMAHVCALRARSFAEAMARRAHQVVVLSETLRPDDDASADELGRALMAHDWTIPFRLACPPRRAPLLRRAREIAKRSAAPWAMDLKDGWDQFVPAGMRGSTARRFAGAAAATALSEAHAAELGARFTIAAEVVYSGIPTEALDPPGPAHRASDSDIVVSGSLYESESVDILIAGFRRWLADGPDGARPRLRYFGADGDRLREAASGLDHMCEIDIPGYRPLDELFEAFRDSRVNLYVRSPRMQFHHKLIELLSCGRPIVSIHQESVEAHRIAAELGGRLTGCDSATEVARRLGEAWSSDAFVPPERDRMARYTWDGQAAVLERVLERVVD